MYRGHLEEGNVQGWMFKGIRVDSALATQLHTKEPRRTAKIHKGVEVCIVNLYLSATCIIYTSMIK